MNFLGNFQTMDDAYPEIVSAAIRSGDVRRPRDLECYELRPACFTIEDSTKTLYGGSQRRLNYRFWVVEALGYVAGVDETWYMALLERVNSGYSKYKTPEGTLAGAYGPKLSLSLRAVEQRLHQDRDTRQAVCSLWSPGENLDQQNLMCTCSLHFFMNSQEELDLHVYMRSNDLNWGTPYDVPAFALLQQVVACSLAFPPGAYHHTAGSLHVYAENPPELGGAPLDLAIPHVPCECVDEATEHAYSYLQLMLHCDNLSHFESPESSVFHGFDQLVRLGRPKL